MAELGEVDSVAEKLAALEAAPVAVDAATVDVSAAPRLQRARSIRTAGDVLNPVNAPDQDGKSSLIRAAYAGDAAEVAALLEKGATLGLADHGGMTALIWASNKGRTDCVKVLLDAGADAKVADSHGRTAWFYADMRDYDEIKKMLEAKGGGAGTA